MSVLDIEFTSASEAAGGKISGAVAALAFEDSGLGAAARALDAATGGAVARAQGAGRFAGKPGQILELLAPSGVGASRIVIIGVGKQSELKRDGVERAAACAVRHLLVSGETALTLHLGGIPASPEDAAAAALAAQMAAYRFDAYRTKLKPERWPSLETLRIVVDDVEAAGAAWEALQHVAEGVALARTLVNEPANIIYPESFAARVKELESHGLEVEILGEKEMRRLGMNALLGVGQGSRKESQLAIMKWNGGGKDQKPICFVGKGVCFDTGGISLKPGDGMWDMKGDMGGAAAVTGAMRALAGRKAKVNVVGVIGLVENMPDGDAQRPGDIVVSANGQTIEVLNTDAEGRLVLADAVWYAQKEFDPKFLVDLATLTGAMIIALGNEQAGVFTNSDTLWDRLRAAGEAGSEAVWRMPLGAAYDRLIDSENADMKNIGGRAAGSISAAQFIKRFINEGRDWAHIDIAGVAMKDKREDPREPVWGTGWGVRLLDRLAAAHEN
jgi:leucyl aminopeptidase